MDIDTLSRADCLYLFVLVDLEVTAFDARLVLLRCTMLEALLQLFGEHPLRRLVVR